MQPKVAGVMILRFLAFVMITTVQVPVKVTLLLFTALISSLFLLGGAVPLFRTTRLVTTSFMHVYNRIQLVEIHFLTHMVIVSK